MQLSYVKLSESLPKQFVWDLKQRGVADIDIPVLVLGLAA